MRARRSASAVLVLACLVLCVALQSAGTAAAPPTGSLGQIGTLATGKTTEYRDWDWATPDPVALYPAPGGDLGVVRHNPGTESLTVDVYDPATRTLVGASKTVSLAGWPLWGRFYAGTDGHFYVLVGRENPLQEDARDVVAVRRYDASWSLVGTAYVKGGVTQDLKGIYTPFAFGHPRMTQVGDRLVVHMSRVMYMTNDGVRHQANLTFEVDVDTMVATTFGELGEVPYSSHSFQQLVSAHGSRLVAVDHGDAFPRAVQVAIWSNYPASRGLALHEVFQFNGVPGNNYTGAAVTGLVNGSQGIVVLGHSIQHPDAPDGTLGSFTENRNAFAVKVNATTGAATVQWLTSFSADGTQQAGEPRVVQVASDRWAVLFDVRDGATHRLEYRLLDSAGTVLASATFPGVFHTSIADPVLIGSDLYWVGIEEGASHPAPAYLFGLRVSNPTAPLLLSAARPTAPTGVGAAVATPNALRVTFSAPQSHGGSVIKHYTAKCWSKDGGVTVSRSGAASPIVVLGLSAAKTYRCAVKAVNAIGAGPFSTSSARVKLPVGAPDAPTNPSAVVLSATSARVSFTAPAWNGGSPIKYYTARCASTNGGSTVSNSRAASPITVAGLTTGRSYRCAVKAVNALGRSVFSAHTAAFVP